MKHFSTFLLAFSLLLFTHCTSDSTDEPDPGCSQSNLSLQLDNSAGGTCTNKDGSLAVKASGGSPPYTYSLDGTAFQAAARFEQLTAGSYTVTVKDNLGCTARIDATVSTEEVSLARQVQPLIQNKCALSSCHGGSVFPDLRVKTNIINNAMRIRTQVASGAMPLTGSLTATEKSNILCWVDNGAKDN